MSATGVPSPLVSFVVPCYKHGHFLEECVRSILAQTYTTFEILVMDDCSPDDTPAIAQSFGDPRVRHIRNEENLGHLRNYNKGIGLARGKYVWLINVDDYLLRPYVLERFVTALETHPSASFVICPAIQTYDGVEGPACGSHGTVDAVFAGSEFLKRLVIRNQVATPSAMVRKASYDRMGLFELDLPYAGDWFQWCRHALFGDVAYLAEPMVCYRYHDLNMSKSHREQRLPVIADEVEVRWRTKNTAERLGRATVVRDAIDAIAVDYGNRVAQSMAGQSKFGMTFAEFEGSLYAHCDDAVVRRRITGTVLASVGDHFYHQGDLKLARHYYVRALRMNPRDPRTWLKSSLLATGTIGRSLRATLTSRRQCPAE
jgi:glycosyltransferase involved in cell wall biosynthesis